jgi:hypothetical protein
MDKCEQKCRIKFFFLQGKRHKAIYEDLGEFLETPLSVWQQLSVGANGSKRVVFPSMTKTDQGDR